MDPTDLTIKILEQIRDSIGHTNERLDLTNGRLDVLTARVIAGQNRTAQAVESLAVRIDTLTDRVVEGEVRTATAIMALGGTLTEVKGLLKDRLDLSDRLQRCEHDIVVLKERTAIK